MSLLVTGSPGREGGGAEGAEGGDSIAKAFNSSFRWISSAASAALGTQKRAPPLPRRKTTLTAPSARAVPENPALSCFLTTLTVHWNTIWMDLLGNIAKTS